MKTVFPIKQYLENSFDAQKYDLEVCVNFLEDYVQMMFSSILMGKWVHEAK